MGDDWGASISGVDSLDATFDSVEDRWVGTDEWVVGTNVSYAVHVEFGTSKMDAQPFIRPAVRHVVEHEGDRLANEADGVGDLTQSLALAVEAEAKDRTAVDTGHLRRSIQAQQIR